MTSSSVLMPPPQLHLEAGAADHVVDQGEILPHAAPGAVQVHHMDVPGAGVVKGPGHGERILRHLMDRAENPFVKPDHFPVLQVYGWKQYHRFSSPKIL